MSKRYQFPTFKVVNGNVTAELNLKRFERQFEKAQFWLDGQVMQDVIPFMPFRDGNQVNVSKIHSAAMQGTGKVVVGTPPYGPFLYEGKVMIDPETQSPWARKGAKKIVTDRNLEFDKTAHPDVTDHWFEPSKQKHGKAWLRGVKKIAGGR